MNDWEIPISILLWYVSLIVFAFVWFEKIVYFLFMFKVYIFITIMALKWSFFFGTKGYYVAYSTIKDEPGEIHIISFPIIWM